LEQSEEYHQSVVPLETLEQYLLKHLQFMAGIAFPLIPKLARLSCFDVSTPADDLLKKFGLTMENVTAKGRSLIFTKRQEMHLI